MSEASIIKIDEAPSVQRGDGIETKLLVGKEVCASKITTGITRFPAGTVISMHKHNCNEQVTVLEGEADVEIDGKLTRVGPMDTTYIPEGLPHRFINVGDGPLAILWIYDTDTVTRTFIETGKTVAHLSAQDLARPE